jgi:DNA-binding NtrC family response regulator
MDDPFSDVDPNVFIGPMAESALYLIKKTGLPFNKCMVELERTILAAAARDCSNNHSAMARLLKVPRQTIVSKLKRFKAL